MRRLADSEDIDFRGLLTHAGHAYRARSRSEAYEVACEERNLMTAFAAEVRDLGVEIPEVSVGSTPTLRAIDDLTGISEARPGNYVFFDAIQVALGSCDLDDQHPLPGLRIVSLTQEHGKLEGPGVEALHPGTRLRVIPNHSCLSASCFDRYHVIRGTEVVDEWLPVRGW